MYGNANQVFEVFSDSDAITANPTANLTGGQLVKLAAGGTARVPNVTPAAAGDPVYGVAAWDVVANERVTVLRKGVFDLPVGSTAVTPGPVQADANGRVIPRTTGQIVGYAHNDAAPGDFAAVALSI